MRHYPKYTPGPLRPHKGAGDGDDYEPDRWCVVVDGPKPYLVATIENGAPGDCLDTEAGNARLFAAAPDLLVACVGMAERLEEYVAELDRDRMFAEANNIGRIAATLRAAAKKATT